MLHDDNDQTVFIKLLCVSSAMMPVIQISLSRRGSFSYTSECLQIAAGAS